jgi:hypothetical protein
LAFLLATLMATGFAVISVYSFFYEGWGQPFTTAAVFLLPAVLLIGVCAGAVRWPRAGGLLLLAGALGAGTWWLWRQSVSDGMTASVWQTAIVLFVPVLLTGGCFLFEAHHRRLLAAEGVRPSPRWWVRNYRLAVILGVPVLAVAVGPAQQLPDLLARHDDGLRGIRTITGNGVTLVWAPQGPGWNWRQPNGTYPSWNVIATYGVSPVGFKPATQPGNPQPGPGEMARTGLCGYLSEDGASLLPEPIHAWRLPTADEVTRSLTRGGRNAGCVWDGRSSHATCAQPPDKETPLWAPDQAPIYYLTADAPDPDGAPGINYPPVHRAGRNQGRAGRAEPDGVLGVNYTGGMTWHLRTASGLGYRCVKPAK